MLTVNVFNINKVIRRLFGFYINKLKTFSILRARKRQGRVSAASEKIELR